MPAFLPFPENERFTWENDLSYAKQLSRLASGSCYCGLFSVHVTSSFHMGLLAPIARQIFACARDGNFAIYQGPIDNGEWVYSQVFSTYILMLASTSPGLLFSTTTVSPVLHSF